MATQSPSNEQLASSALSSSDRPAESTFKEDGISILELLTILVERRRLLLWFTGTFAILTVVITLLLRNWYTATVTLVPPQQGSSLSAALASQLGNLGGLASMAGGSLGLKNPNDMYVAMLKSRTVEDAMIRKFGLMQEYHKRYLTDTRKAFEHHSKVDGSGKDGLIHISFEDPDPNRAAALANAYVEEFRELSKHLAITEASQRRLFFEQQLEEAKNNLASAEENLKRTEQTTGLIQPDSQARALIETAATIRAQITAKEVQIHAMQTFATGENAQLIQAQKELESLRAQLAELGGNGENNEASLLVTKGRVPEAGLEYIRKLRDVKYYETIFEILARQFEAAKLDEAKQGAVIQVVDSAIPPDKKSFPLRTVFTIIGTFIGFLVGVLVVLFDEVLGRMLRDPEIGPGMRRLRLAFKKQRSDEKPVFHSPK
jgi:tyrosine-protein kinase Etk/Wzc